MIVLVTPDCPAASTHEPTAAAHVRQFHADALRTGSAIAAEHTRSIETELLAGEPTRVLAGLLTGGAFDLMVVGRASKPRRPWRRRGLADRLRESTTVPILVV